MLNIITNFTLIGFVFLLFGIATLGIFLPILPGVMLGWLAILIYAASTNFTAMSLGTVIWLLALALLTVAIDFLAPMVGAKRFNASAAGIAGAALGLVIGLIILGPIGIVAGPFLGAFLGELLSGKHERQAVHSALGAMLGFLAGTLIKLIAVLIMLGFFIAALI